MPQRRALRAQSILLMVLWRCLDIDHLPRGCATKDAREEAPVGQGAPGATSRWAGRRQSGDPGGDRDAERITLYRDFMRNLHARLAPDRYPEIRLTAGVSNWHDLVMLGSAIATAPVVALAGLGGYLFYHLSNGFLLLVVGEYFCWKLARRALANAPCDDAPDRLPEELLA